MNGDAGSATPAFGSDTPGSATGLTPRAILGGLTYVQAVAWIVARLAEGLQHAHERGVLHRDIKPSNVLLGADGQPMLLDFNLAHESEHRRQAQAMLGGTVAYMAPEHLRAMVGRSPALNRQVDQRVRHLLAGDGPLRDARRPPPLRPERQLLRRCPCRSRRWPRSAAGSTPSLRSAAARTSPGAWRASSASAWPPTRPSATSRPSTWPRTCAASWTTGRCDTPRS